MITLIIIIIIRTLITFTHSVLCSHLLFFLVDIYASFTEECSGSGCGECTWHGGNGQWSPGGGGHSLTDCKKACLAEQHCNYVSLSSDGYCHLSATCSSKTGNGWTRLRRNGMSLILINILNDIKKTKFKEDRQEL